MNEKRSEESKQIYGNNPQFEFKNSESKGMECSQNVRVYKEEIIVREINANIRVNEIMEPMFGNLMSDKKEYDIMKYANDRKEMKLMALQRKQVTIELKENLINQRKKIAELIEKIKEEKEKLFAVQCQTNSLLYMLEVRKNDLVIKKKPVVGELMLAPKLSQQTDKEIEDLNNKVIVLNQLYVFIIFIYFLRKIYTFFMKSQIFNFLA